MAARTVAVASQINRSARRRRRTTTDQGLPGPISRPVNVKLKIRMSSVHRKNDRQLECALRVVPAPQRRAMAVSAELPRPAVGGIADDPIFKFRDTQRMAYLAKREQSGTGRAAVDRRFRWTPDKVVAALRERLQGNFAATRRAFRAIDRDCAGSCDAVRFRRPRRPSTDTRPAPPAPASRGG